MKKAFTLIEMLIVIGIISVLIGASLASFGKMRKMADKTKAQELVSQTAAALTAIFEADGMWPKKIRTESSSGNGKLDKDVALILAKRGYMALSMKDGKLTGKDQFGIVTPWAADVVGRYGQAAANRKVGNRSFDDHILRFAVDLDGDGIVEQAGEGKENVRATVAVWCLSKDGKSQIQSWTKGQTQAVK